MVVERLGKQLGAGLCRTLTAEAKAVAKPAAKKIAAVEALPPHARHRRMLVGRRADA